MIYSKCPSAPQFRPTYLGERRGWEVGSRTLGGKRIQGEVKRHVPKTYLFIESYCKSC